MSVPVSMNLAVSRLARSTVRRVSTLLTWRSQRQPFADEPIQHKSAKRRHHLATVLVALSLAAALWPFDLSWADDGVVCGVVLSAREQRWSPAPLRDGLPLVQAHVAEMVLALRAQEPVDARVQYELFLEVWGDVARATATAYPAKCAEIAIQLELLDDALAGRVGDEALDSSLAAVNHLEVALSDIERDLDLRPGD